MELLSIFNYNLSKIEEIESLEESSVLNNKNLYIKYFSQAKDLLFNNSSTIIRSKLSNIFLVRRDSYDGYYVDFFGVSKLKKLYLEKIYEIEPPLSKNEIIKKNLIRSKNNNIDFFISLGEMIVGDNDCFPPKSSMNITKFFEDSGFPGYKYNGDTKKFWVAKILESLDIDDLYRVIQNLFKRKYFIKSGKDIGVAKSNFKDFIESSLNADELPDLSDVFDLNINTDLLFNEDVETSDGVLNSDIEAARELFIQGNLQLANEKIWDALERVKSLYDKDKKKSVNSIVRVLSDELTDKNNKEKAPLQDYIFNLELRCLTDIGNSYKIRHSEDGQKVIENEETKRYLFFRCLNLINLVLKRMS